MPKGASPNTDVTPGSVEFGFLSVGNDPGKWVFPMLQFGSCVFYRITAFQVNLVPPTI